ncbi:hypothetical protein HAX54_008024 [Datura stramonium]|uniref:Uncharacterized protein n=1 Tax=Datura stramonium TaxID=4076 RepID=A0ABS8WUZ5_DATST|nr:hypothetical protein [Datura stramonium]
MSIDYDDRRGELHVSDELLGTIVPIVVYWVYSGLYCMLGGMENYRLHTKKDEDEKNLVSKKEVVKGVLLQQVVQGVVATVLFASQILGNTLCIATHVHQNKFLYRYIHSQHHRHRAICIWSFVQSPFRGLILDTIGGALAFPFSQACLHDFHLLLLVATIKTVDDHCGLWLPGNLFHVVF